MPEGVVVSINVLGEQQINRRMLRFAARAGSAEPALELVHEYLVELTGELKDSLTMQGHPDMVHVVTPSTMIYGTNLKRGQWHQKPAPSASYPRRRSVDLTVENKLVMMKTIQLWIVRGVARLGRGSRFRF
jgi:hypothetical protein